MSDQRLPLSPDKRVETAQTNFRLSGDHAGPPMVEDDVLAVCAPGTSEVLCGTIERTESCQGHVEGDDVAVADSRDFPGTMDYTRNDILARQVLRSRERIVVLKTMRKDWGTQTTSISNPATLAVKPIPGTVVAQDRSRSPRDVSKVDRKPSVSLLFTSHTSLVFVMQHSGAEKVAAGRQAADVHRG